VLRQVEHRVGEVLRAHRVAVVGQHAEAGRDRGPPLVRRGEAGRAIRQRVGQLGQQAVVDGVAQGAGRVRPKHIGRRLVALLLERGQQLRVGAVAHADRHVRLLSVLLDERINEGLAAARVDDELVLLLPAASEQGQDQGDDEAEAEKSLHERCV
jgi:hypothetical protein